MLRLVPALLVVAVVAASGTSAEAGRYKVVIETEPPGAAVYFNDTEGTPVCAATPCTVDVPATETVVYLQLKNYTPGIVSVDPAKKAQRIKQVLKPAVGTINIKGAAGARVQIEDEDKGKAPDKFELGEGGYHVVVTAPNGKVLFDDYVEVKAGDESVVTPSGAVATVDPPEGGEVETGPTITKPGPVRAHDRYFLASVAVDIGFRSFTYDNNQTMGTLLDDNEAGQVLVGPMVELWPMAILGVDKLPGLSVLARYQYNVNSQAVTTDGGAKTSLATFWQDIEASVRYRWMVADAIGLQVRGGYNNEARAFSGNQSDIDKVPSAVYQALHLGARVSASLGKVEPYLVVENRIVFNAGPIAERFPGGADASGLHGALGLAVQSGPFNARLEGGLTRYTWTFKANAGDLHVATGGTDSMSQISLSAGYAY